MHHALATATCVVRRVHRCEFGYCLQASSRSSLAVGIAHVGAAARTLRLPMTLAASSSADWHVSGRILQNRSTPSPKRPIENLRFSGAGTGTHERTGGRSGAAGTYLRWSCCSEGGCIGATWGTCRRPGREARSWSASGKPHRVPRCRALLISGCTSTVRRPGRSQRCSEGRGCSRKEEEGEDREAHSESGLERWVRR
jgi:hypothetical protein